MSSKNENPKKKNYNKKRRTTHVVVTPVFIDVFTALSGKDQLSIREILSIIKDNDNSMGELMYFHTAIGTVCARVQDGVYVMYQQFIDKDAIMSVECLLCGIVETTADGAYRFDFEETQFTKSP